ncbi:MAG: adenylate/guanylate cyclase domain-containing protein [Elainellaceae cyanobacterium]
MGNSELSSYLDAASSGVVQSPSNRAYQSWRRRFMLNRIRLGLTIAIVAYFTFILLRAVHGIMTAEWDFSWLVMAITAELGLVLCLLLQYTSFGQQHPAVLFLGASWSITLVEQIWATLQQIAFPGLFSWTLVFLTQSTLIPVRWPLHLVSQLGVLIYYFGVNSVFGLSPRNGTLWNGRQALYVFWFCAICNLAVYLYEQLQKSEFEARCRLEAEQEKSERLLLNILPEAIAEKLKQEQRIIADSFAEATVLFADIVGFTRLSAGVPPHDVVDLLNRVFSTFDQLVERHNLEKIKTIGDAYMVVGGLPIERNDHVEAVAELALDMQHIVAQFKTQENQPLQLRIGINTGPVIAGVIGRKKFIYDLWGDAVNVASRMESQGIAGCIQVTPAVYERLGDRYQVERRGTIDVKGKGLMTTYLLLGRHDDSLEPHAA